MAEHNQLGSKGEDLASNYLSEKGYKIIERNWRHGRGEIDIICSRENHLVVVEVKSRSTDFFGQPEEAVTKKKQKFLILAADAYINQNNLMLEVRYDIVSIIFQAQAHKILHIEDAFYPTL